MLAEHTAVQFDISHVLLSLACFQRNCAMPMAGQLLLASHTSRHAGVRPGQAHSGSAALEMDIEQTYTETDD